MSHPNPVAAAKAAATSVLVDTSVPEATVSQPAAKAKATPAAKTPPAPKAKEKEEPKAPSQEKDSEIPKGYERLYNRGKRTYTLPNGDKDVKCIPKRAIILPKKAVDRWVKAFPKDLVRFEDYSREVLSPEPEASPESLLQTENRELKAELAVLKEELQAFKTAQTEV